MMRSIPYLLCLIASCSVLLSCSGGGGGGSAYDPLSGADVYLSVEPDEIGVGERVLVSIYAERINPDGVLIVVRFPSEALAYVSETSRFIVGGNEVPINPTFGPAVGDRRTYLTYFLPYAAFAEENAGFVELQLRAERRAEGALIEVDEILHNPAIPPEREFSTEDPDFSPEDAERINIDTKRW